MHNPLLPFSLLIKRGLLAIFLAVMVNALVFLFVTRATLVEPFGALTAPPVIFLTIFGSIAATAVYGAITRISPYPDRVFVATAGVALLVSFIPNVIVLVADPEATLGAVLVLMSMHVTVAFLCVFSLTDSYSPLTRSPEQPTEQQDNEETTG